MLRLRWLLCAWALVRGAAGVAKDGDLLWVPGGKVQVGTHSFDSRNEDRSPRKVEPFLMDKYPVTNRDFREFVRDRKYKTEAEEFGWSFVFEDFVPEALKKKVMQKLEALKVCTMVAASREGVLEAACRPRIWHQGQTGSSGSARQLERRPSLLRVEGEAASDRGGVGAGGQGRPAKPAVPLGKQIPGQSHQPLAGQLPQHRHRRGRLPRRFSSGRFPPTEQLRLLRPAGKYVGVDGLGASPGRPQGPPARPGDDARPAGRLLGGHGRRLGQSQGGGDHEDGEHPRLGLRQPWLPLRR